MAQKYKFADCNVVWNDDTFEKNVVIALANMKELGFAFNSEEDKQIMYYCLDYEKFLELLVKGNDKADFYIEKVNGIYEEL